MCEIWRHLCEIGSRVRALQVRRVGEMAAFLPARTCSRTSIVRRWRKKKLGRCKSSVNRLAPASCILTSVRRITAEKWKSRYFYSAEAREVISYFRQYSRGVILAEKKCRRLHAAALLADFHENTNHVRAARGCRLGYRELQNSRFAWARAGLTAGPTSFTVKFHTIRGRLLSVSWQTIIGCSVMLKRGLFSLPLLRESYADDSLVTPPRGLVKVTENA